MLHLTSEQLIMKTQVRNDGMTHCDSASNSYRCS